MSVSWNPWHGCRKISEGCRNCYVYRQDSRHDKDSREVRQTAMFDRPVRRSRDGRFKVPAGEMVYTCFTSDFLLEEADAWRAEAWEMMRIRHDLRFLFFTKRIDRLAAVLVVFQYQRGSPVLQFAFDQLNLHRRAFRLVCCKNRDKICNMQVQTLQIRCKNTPRREILEFGIFFFE